MVEFIAGWDAAAKTHPRNTILDKCDHEMDIKNRIMDRTLKPLPGLEENMAKVELKTKLNGSSVMEFLNTVADE